MKSGAGGDIFSDFKITFCPTQNQKPFFGKRKILESLQVALYVYKFKNKKNLDSKDEFNFLL